MALSTDLSAIGLDFGASLLALDSVKLRMSSNVTRENIITGLF